jgi:hypothetical protein
MSFDYVIVFSSAKNVLSGNIFALKMSTQNSLSEILLQTLEKGV